MINNEHIHLIAKLKAKPARLDELVEAIEKILPVVRKEPGCITYNLHRDRNDPSTLVMLETWETRSALDTHVEATSFQSLKPILDVSLSEPLSLTFLERLA